MHTLNETLQAWLSTLSPDRLFVLVDEVVAGLINTPELIAQASPHEIPVTIHAQEAGTIGKELGQLHTLLTAAENAELSRSSVCVFIGGGNVGNLAGTVAGLVCRGLPYLHVPTTITAALDSAIGQKQSVNGATTKNYFGLLHAPTAVIIDPRFLLTLPEIELVGGLVESVKHALCQDLDLLPFVHDCVTGKSSRRTLHTIIARTIALKDDYLSQDPFEMSDGQFLELGHKIGHAVEFLEHGRLSHGDSVAFGMLAEARLAHCGGYAQRETLRLVEEAIEPLLAELRVPEAPAGDIARQVRLDNRRRGHNVFFAFLRTPLHPVSCSLDPRRIEAELEAAIAWAYTRLRAGDSA
jgi:3-dehydroquinate synthase